jgi:hypothetical protein
MPEINEYYLSGEYANQLHMQDGEFVHEHVNGTLTSRFKAGNTVFTFNWTSGQVINDFIVGGMQSTERHLHAGSMTISGADENIVISDNLNRQRVILGKQTQTGGYGLQVNNTNGSSVFKLWGGEADLAGWILGTDSLYKINGTSKIELNSAAEVFRVTHDGNVRVVVGKISGNNYGIQVKSANGNSDIFSAYGGTEGTFGGFNLTSSSFHTPIAADSVVAMKDPAGSDDTKVFFAGADDADGTDAKFYIHRTGFGKVGTWLFESDGLKSAPTDSAKIRLDGANQRITTEDASNDTLTAQGYLGGLKRGNGIGTANSGTTSTLTDTDKDWHPGAEGTGEEPYPNGELFGLLLVVAFAGGSQTKTILSNTSDTITIIGSFDNSEDVDTEAYYVTYPVNNYGFWAKQGERMAIDGDVIYESGDWLIQNNASLKFFDADGDVRLWLGDRLGTKGLYIGSAISSSGLTGISAQYLENSFRLGDVDGTNNYLDYTGGVLKIQGRIILTNGQEITDVDEIEGTPATQYSIIVTGSDTCVYDPNALDNNGDVEPTFTPTAISFGATKKTGSDDAEGFTTGFWSINNGTWTAHAGGAHSNISASDNHGTGYVQARLSLNIEGTQIVDTETVPILDSGGSNFFMDLSNQNISVSQDTDGDYDITLAKTEVELYQGATEVTTAGAIDFTVNAGNFAYSYDNVSYTGFTGSGVFTSGVWIKLLNADTLPASVTLAHSSGVSQTFTVNGSFFSLGTNARTIKLTPDTNIFRYDEGDSKVAGQDIDFTVTTTGVTGTPTYRFESTPSTGGAGYQAYSATDTFTLIASQEPPLDGYTRVKVLLKEDGTYVANDTVTIYAVQDGSGAYSGFLSNEAHVVSSVSDGSGVTTASLNTAGGTFQTFYEDSEQSGTYSVDVTNYAATQEGLTLAINPSTGVYSITGTWDNAGDTLVWELKAIMSSPLPDPIAINRTYTLTKSVGLSDYAAQCIVSSQGIQFENSSGDVLSIWDNAGLRLGRQVEGFSHIDLSTSALTMWDEDNNEVFKADGGVVTIGHHASTNIGLDGEAGSITMGNFSVDASGDVSVDDINLSGYITYATGTDNNITLGQGNSHLGTNNILIGKNAGADLEENADHCVYIGTSSGKHQTGGVGYTDYTTAVGTSSIRNSTFSYANSAFGYGAMHNATCSECTAVGFYAMGGEGSNEVGSVTQSVAVGMYAMANVNHTADAVYNDTAVGYKALYSVTGNAVDAAQQNSGFGWKAGDSLTTGRYNTMVGGSTDSGVAAGSNMGSFGYGAYCTASNTITLGNNSITHLRCAVTGITAISDMRDKKDIEDLPYGLDFINSLQPRKFVWNNRDDSDNKGSKDIGFIAQEFQTVDNDWINLVYDADPDKLETTNEKLIPVLVKAIQELSAKVEILEQT